MYRAEYIGHSMSETVDIQNCLKKSYISCWKFLSLFHMQFLLPSELWLYLWILFYAKFSSKSSLKCYLHKENFFNNLIPNRLTNADISMDLFINFHFIRENLHILNSCEFSSGKSLVKHRLYFLFVNKTTTRDFSGFLTFSLTIYSLSFLKEIEITVSYFLLSTNCSLWMLTLLLVYLCMWRIFPAELKDRVLQLRILHVKK